MKPFALVSWNEICAAASESDEALKASLSVKLISQLSSTQNSVPPYVYYIECAVNVSGWIAFYQKKVGFQTSCNFASVRKAKASGAD